MRTGSFKHAREVLLWTEICGKPGVMATEVVFNPRPMNSEGHYEEYASDDDLKGHGQFD